MCKKISFIACLISEDTISPDSSNVKIFHILGIRIFRVNYKIHRDVITIIYNVNNCRKHCREMKIFSAFLTVGMINVIGELGGGGGKLFLPKLSIQDMLSGKYRFQQWVLPSYGCVILFSEKEKKLSGKALPAMMPLPPNAECGKEKHEATEGWTMS